MFESIQDYLNKLIDKDTLLENLVLCDEYSEANQSVKEQLDLFIEDIKDAKDDNKLLEILSSDYLFDIGVQPDQYKLLDLATRTNGGAIPFLDPAVLAAFIDLCIENDDDERLFRLAYNYDEMMFDKTKIEDYFINSNNIFYVNELACNDLKGINYEKLKKVILDSNQLDELKYFATNVYDKSIDISSVLEKIKELDK